VIGALKKLIEEVRGQEGAAETDEADDLRLATVALLVEMTRADFEVGEAERQRIGELVAEHYRLEAHEAKALLAAADRRADHAVSLHEFTSMLHESLDDAEKRTVMAMLIRTALADGRIDDHEQHLLSKVADLLYLRKSDFVMLRASIIEEETGRKDGARETGSGEGA
jgi:uncharacterized tellurite resistance protein B-like protein